MSDARGRLDDGLRAVRSGVLANAGLAVVKGVAGVVGHSFALVADAVESLADILGSLVVWSGLRVSAQDADQDHPWGHGKAEPLAAGIVGLMLVGAAFGILVKAVHGILVPHPVPRAWTLIVIALVVLVKETLFRRVNQLADAIGSGVVAADAWHHRSDAISSAAAFVGVGIAVLGGQPLYWADEAAAIVAAFLIAMAAWRILRPAAHELMDGAPEAELLGTAAAAARGVGGVRRIEKLMARKVGTRHFVDLHVQADPTMSLHDAHILSGKVKTAIRRALPSVENVLVHMEPFEPGPEA
ncbi:MAG: cation diffusion facilitator family transporter [Gemmatimonadales bacterium]|nr:cation diffusion facilitator family transporter [Gemmatimonadales bacterium]HRX19888.1 cation diffusion facilitator family transporter [Gemmatimonadales bacterium]